ncbi:unnamed protein product [Lupinus luteus]|uniref:Uncharacterized protein n=1 Tax=Lupinus luteus TaxID=3873 RepID=A0AAV1XGA7_LUPLU
MDKVSCLEGFVIGEFQRVEDIFSIKDIMAKEGFLLVKAIPVGGRCVLLKGSIEGDIQDV